LYPRRCANWFWVRAPERFIIRFKPSALSIVVIIRIFPYRYPHCFFAYDVHNIKRFAVKMRGAPLKNQFSPLSLTTGHHAMR
jgi:hypothetical protein